jgi:rare lipoprotein A
MNRSLNALLFIAVFGLAACNPTPPKTPPKPTDHPFFTEIGVGSQYSNWLVGRKTAAGGRFTQDGLTAAHQSLPFGRIVRVTNLDNGLSVKVAIDDRGPYAKGRIIDLSSAAAQALGIQEEGIANVKLEAFKTDQARDTE